MGLLEDLNSGKYNLILFGIIFAFIFYQFWRKKTEPMADVASLTEDKVKELIYKIYLNDVTAIKNLADIANKLQDEKGLTIPGDIIVKGKISSDGEISTKSSYTLPSFNGNLENFNRINAEINNNIKVVDSSLDYITKIFRIYNDYLREKWGSKYYDREYPQGWI